MVLTPVQGERRCSCCRKQHDPATLESNSPPVKPDFPLQPWEREKHRHKCKCNVLNCRLSVWFHILHSDVKHTSVLNDALRPSHLSLSHTHTHTHKHTHFLSLQLTDSQLTESDDLEKLKYAHNYAHAHTHQLCVSVYVFSGANNSHIFKLIRVL